MQKLALTQNINIIDNMKSLPSSGVLHVGRGRAPECKKPVAVSIAAENADNQQR